MLKSAKAYCFFVFVQVVLVVGSGFFYHSQAQPFGPSPQQLTVEEGLSHNWVRSIIKDRQGFMWFGTFNGLNRYDGKNFKTYRVNTGNNLSDNFIESLAEDKDGNIWVGTFSGGLNLFDRETEQFTTFEHDPKDNTTISGNRIYALYPDKNKKLWIGTDAGLDLYDDQTKTFTHFQYNPGNKSGISEGLVSTIYQDHSGLLWIGTNKALNLFDPKTKEFKKFYHDQNDPTSLTHNYVKSIFEDKYGNMWIGTWGGGLNLFDRETGSFEPFQANPNQPGGLNNNAIMWLTGDQDGNIYIGTEGGGLNVFDIQTRKFSHYVPSLSNPKGIRSNSIHALFYDDESGILWIGSYNDGVNFFCRWDKPFVHHQAQENGLRDNHVNCIAEDNDGNLWIGTDGGGVSFLNEKTGTYRYYTHQEKNSNSLMSDAVLSILCDSKNNVWIGTFNGGLDLLNPKTNSFTHFRHEPSNSKALAGEHASAIYEDKRGNIWVGTMTGGLHLYNSNGTFTRFQNNPVDTTTILDNFIIGIYEDRKGGLLIQTGKGLEVFDYKTKSFERFNKSSAINFDVPSAVLEDRHGNLWLGSQEMGLFKISRPGNKVTRYTDNDGLPSNGVSAILEDNTGNLWVSTLKGLCKFDNATNASESPVKFHIYSVEDGLQGTEFTRGARCKKKNGQLVFGGQNGFNVFDPLAIKDNPFIPPVKITGFKVFNKDVNFGSTDLLEKPIHELEALTLTHKESVFTFEFSALNFMLSEKNKYAYKLEGFDKDWNYVGNQSSATYTNLDAGDYVFKVKASNNDGIWNETGAAITITVLPPWWNSIWFRVLMITVISGAAISFYKFRTYQLKQGKKELEHQVKLRTSALQEASTIIEERHEEIQIQNESLLQKNNELEKQATEISRMAEEIKALNEVKLRFFTNISHELRTPLNLIIWPLEEMLKNKIDQKSLNEKYNLMHKNAARLIKLINQLLDFQKIETGALQLKLEQKNIIQSVQDIFDSFKDWAQRYHVHYVLESNTDQINMWFDEDKLEKILSNLLSNAFKYVEESGTINVSVMIEADNEGKNSRVAIRVQDNGKGIPEDQLGLIFNRFYEANTSRVPGTGIGLALVKELVELHHGEISVRSKLKEGTIFEFKLPTGLEGTEQHLLINKKIRIADEDYHELSDVEISETGDIRENIPLLLIVEDNEDIRNYISQKLGDTYNIELAENGKQGVDKAFELVPDLIISDVMMPELDGFELCKQLKSDERTSHVPIILVTARSGEEAQLQGLTIGADDYITKPFKLNLLQLKIRNVLYTRQKLKEQFLKNPYFAPESLQVPSADEAFLKKAVAIIEENLDNSEFGVEDFSDYFKMSRRNVLRKIKGLTGLSINEFIKNIRLKESHKLLVQGKLNVAEVAYSVGFNDQKYFSKCFKEHFGMTPSEVTPSVR
jgi:signal transduction histidine kinase/ligand-binding sensor domain-containing protein/DNA-binding response OmpR family regulator